MPAIILCAIAVAGMNLALWLFWRERRQRRRVEKSLALTRANLREIQQLAHIGGWEYDIRTDGIRWTEETFHIFGLPSGQQEPDFANVLLGIHPDDISVFDRAIQRAVTAQEAYNLDLRIRTADGRQKHIHAQGTPIVNRHGAVERIIGTILDITDRKEAEQRLAMQASHDALTGLANRRYLIEQLNREIAVAERYKTSLAVCIGDLDHFKTINDTYGHLSGDELLVAFGRILTEGTRAGDVTARLGGDEFCILFPRTNGSQARICVERIRARFEASAFNSSDGQLFRATATFGIADWVAGSDYRGLIRAADEALYEAKRLGRNRSAVLACGDEARFRK